MANRLLGLDISLLISQIHPGIWYSEMKENVENETIKIVTENIGEFPIQTGIGKAFLIMTQPFFFLAQH